MNLKILFVASVIFFFIIRFPLLNLKGGDFKTYKEAASNFIKGENIYKNTVESFKDNNDSLENGFAYMPTLLYILSILLIISESLKIESFLPFLWKIPNILMELIILYVILKNLNFSIKKQMFLGLCISLFWIFNPYLIAVYNYSMFDYIFLGFMLLSITHLKKNILLSSLFFSISVSLKTIPIILLPMILMYIFRSNYTLKDKIRNVFKYLLVGLVFYTVISVPFMRSFEDFDYYIKGSLLVHGDREVSGRPLISFINHQFTNQRDFHIQYTFFNLFAYTALIGAALFNGIYFWKSKEKDLFKVGLVTFFIYMIITPVLNRTHLLWITPLFFMFIISLNFDKYFIKQIVSISFLWVILFSYLLFWQNGFRYSKNNPERIVLPNPSKEWELKKVVRNKYYEFRYIIQNRQ